MYLLVIGTLTCGMNFYGPFTSAEAAETRAQELLAVEPTWHAELFKLMYGEQAMHVEMRGEHA